MSFDLAFWKAPAEPGTGRWEIYDSISEEEWGVVVPAPEVLALRRAVLDRHPTWEGSVLEPDMSSVPVDRYVLLTLPFAWATTQVLNELVDLAEHHGLVAFDPQSEEEPLAVRQGEIEECDGGERGEPGGDGRAGLRQRPVQRLDRLSVPAGPAALGGRGRYG